MPVYVPYTWEDEVPSTTPLKFEIIDGATVIAEEATIELVTPVTAGTPVNATRMNQIEQGVFKATQSFCVARVSANYVLPNGGGNIAFGAEDIDEWNGHDTAVPNNTRIVIDENGLYQIHARIIRDAIGSSSSSSLFIYKNGVMSDIGKASLSVSGNVVDGVLEIISPPVLLNAGDYIEVNYNEIDSATHTVKAGSRFAVTKLVSL